MLERTEQSFKLCVCVLQLLLYSSFKWFPLSKDDYVDRTKDASLKLNKVQEHVEKGKKILVALRDGKIVYSLRSALFDPPNSGFLS